jgi:Rps23 Pro-64 3,4-dihydroxylase Tpa1-like proline 4-hydroxylase
MLSGFARSNINQANYLNAKPFPHAVIDSFIEPVIARHIAGELKALAGDESQNWRFPEADAHAEQVLKKGLNDFKKMPPLLSMASDYFNSDSFLVYLQALTGIIDLIADPNYAGGGYHQTGSGGKLGIHHDFNVHTINDKRVFRRVNLLVYMNPAWHAEWGGQLELWKPDLSACDAVIEPLFNRAVLFTIDDAPHGHPTPVACPTNECRRSLAYYYYTEAEPTTNKRLTRAHWKQGNQLV